eukprot:7055342-Prymnesium_polylepis.1
MLPSRRHRAGTFDVRRIPTGRGFDGVDGGPRQWQAHTSWPCHLCGQPLWHHALLRVERLPAMDGCPCACHAPCGASALVSVCVLGCGCCGFSAFCEVKLRWSLESVAGTGSASGVWALASGLYRASGRWRRAGRRPRPTRLAGYICIHISHPHGDENAEPTLHPTLFVPYDHTL